MTTTWVRDIIKTEDGTITFNAYIDATGNSPVIASTSDAFDFDIVPVTDHIGVTLNFQRHPQCWRCPGDHDVNRLDALRSLRRQPRFRGSERPLWAMNTVRSMEEIVGLLDAALTRLVLEDGLR